MDWVCGRKCGSGLHCCPPQCLVWYSPWDNHTHKCSNPAQVVSLQKSENKPCKTQIIWLCYSFGCRLALCFLYVFSCGAALVAGMPLCAVPVHSGRWRAGGGDRVQETERRRLAPNGRNEPLLERDQTKVPQHPVREHSQPSLEGFTFSEPRCLLYPREASSCI